MIKESINLLGHPVEDKVSGFAGVVTSVSFDLPGCVMAVVTPKSHDGDFKDGKWFDVNRLKITGEKVMAAPDFDAKGHVPATYDQGPSDKPGAPSIR